MTYCPCIRRWPALHNSHDALQLQRLDSSTMLQAYHLCWACSTMLITKLHDT